MIETLGNWGEFIGGIAVVISLVYVGLQIRSSVRQTRVDSYTRGTEMWLKYTSIVTSDSETWRIFHHGTRELDSLDHSEQARFGFLISMYFGMIDTFMVHDEAGMQYNPESYRRILEQAFAIYSLPGVQAWWQKGKGRVFAPKVELYLTSRERAERAAA
jgi:hypothetical protein